MPLLIDCGSQRSQPLVPLVRSNFALLDSSTSTKLCSEVCERQLNFVLSDQVTLQARINTVISPVKTS
jgi:hypothetical protein